MSYTFGFTNKLGGVSKGKFQSLNLGLHVGDDAKDVHLNREILRKNLGVEKLIFMDQIHSDNVEIITSKDQILSPCDGVITGLKGVGLCVMVADCMPILVRAKSVVAAVHAGRAGITKKILSKTLNLIKEEFKENEFSIYIGAHIKGSCYEIGDLDLCEFNKFKNDNKFDMDKALESEILELKDHGFKFKDLEISSICTHCDDSYFSYRRDGTTGRFCGYIFIN